MRTLRYETAFLASTLALPLVFLTVFPYRAIGFRAAKTPQVGTASAAFVNLTEDELFEAMRSAKVSWQHDARDRRAMRAELAVGELPDDADFTVLGVNSRQPLPVFGSVAYPTPVFLPSAAAAAPKQLDFEPEAERPPAFSREELLKLRD